MNDSNALLEEERCDSTWCEVRQSGIHGRGIFALREIPKETRVIEYSGERIGKEESNRRGWEQIDHAKKTGDAAVFIFTLDDETDIDGNVPENAARLINHSCAPNCEAFVEDNSIWICALRKINKGEELFYNYGFDLECYEDHPCRCGSKRCIGFIAGEEHWPELKERLAKKMDSAGKKTKPRKSRANESRKAS